LPWGSFINPYLPDVIGSIVCFVCILLLKAWRSPTVLGYGGKLITDAAAASAHGLSIGEIYQAWLPILVLLVVITLWTSPWSSLPKIILFHAAVSVASSIT